MRKLSVNQVYNWTVIIMKFVVFLITTFSLFPQDVFDFYFEKKEEERTSISALSNDR